MNHSQFVFLRQLLPEVKMIFFGAHENFNHTHTNNNNNKKKKKIIIIIIHALSLSLSSNLFQKVKLSRYNPLLYLYNLLKSTKLKIEGPYVTRYDDVRSARMKIDEDTNCKTITLKMHVYTKPTLHKVLLTLYQTTKLLTGPNRKHLQMTKQL